MAIVTVGPADILDVHDRIIDVASRLVRLRADLKESYKQRPSSYIFEPRPFLYPSYVMLNDVSEQTLSTTLRNHVHHLSKVVEIVDDLHAEHEKIATILQTVEDHGITDENQPLVSHLKGFYDDLSEGLVDAEPLRRGRDELSSHSASYYLERAPRDCEAMVEAGLIPEDWESYDAVKSNGIVEEEGLQPVPFNVDYDAVKGFLIERRPTNKAFWEASLPSFEEGCPVPRITGKELKAFRKYLSNDKERIEAGSAVAEEKAFNIFEAGTLIHNADAYGSTWDFEAMLNFSDSGIKPGSGIREGSDTNFPGTISFYLGLSKDQVQSRCFEGTVVILLRRNWAQAHSDRFYYSKNSGEDAENMRYNAVSDTLGFTAVEDADAATRRRHKWDENRFFPFEVQSTQQIPYDAIHGFVARQDFICQLVYFMNALAVRDPEKALPVFDETGTQIWPPG